MRMIWVPEAKTQNRQSGITMIRDIILQSYVAFSTSVAMPENSRGRFSIVRCSNRDGRFQAEIAEDAREY
jgi:hypothetical protein